MLKKVLAVGGAAAALTATSMVAGAPPAYACADVDDCFNQYVSGPGALPGATNPNALVVDPVKAEAKYVRLAKNAPTVSAYLAANALAPVPSSVAYYPPDEDRPPPSSAMVPVGTPAQGNTNWCVPAATSSMLGRWGYNVSLSTLKTEEGTTAKGTPMFNAIPSLRSRVNTTYYMADNNDNAADLMNRVAGSIGSMSAPVMVSVHTKVLSWWQGNVWTGQPKPAQGFHALTIRLYHTSSGGGFEVWDSADAAFHPSPLSEMWEANHLGAGEIIW